MDGQTEGERLMDKFKGGGARSSNKDKHGEEEKERRLDTWMDRTIQVRWIHGC